MFLKAFVLVFLLAADLWVPVFYKVEELYFRTKAHRQVIYAINGVDHMQTCANSCADAFVKLEFDIFRIQ